MVWSGVYINGSVQKKHNQRVKKLSSMFLSCTPINSLAPGRCCSNFKSITLKLIIQKSTLGEITLSWMPQNLTNKRSTLLQIMAWCHQASNHFLSKYRPRSMLPLLGLNELIYIYDFERKIFHLLSLDSLWQLIMICFSYEIFMLDSCW